jgi:hypothetical protein
LFSQAPDFLQRFLHDLDISLERQKILLQRLQQRVIRCGMLECEEFPVRVV